MNVLVLLFVVNYIIVTNIVSVSLIIPHLINEGITKQQIGIGLHLILIILILWISDIKFVKF